MAGVDLGRASRGLALYNAYSEMVLEVFRLNGALIASGDTLTKDLRLTSARWQVLGAILVSPVPLPVAHIARNMGLTRQSVQRTVDELKRIGMVHLQENPHHRRAMLVLATAEGEEAALTAFDRQDRWMDVVNPGLSVEQIETASAVLRQFRNRLEQAGCSAAVVNTDESSTQPAQPDGEQHDRK